MAKQSFIVTLANGKTRTVTPKRDWRKDPVTASQARKISKLLHEREVPSDFRLPKKTTKGGASDLIQRLDKLPVR
jgi:hypothetical protein